MAKFIFLFFLFCVSYSNAGTINRSAKEIRNFDNFLKDSMNGVLSAPLTPELAELQNEEERSGKFEGDILLTEEQRKDLVAAYAGAKNGIISSNRHWPNKVVYFHIDTAFFNAAQIQAIRDGVQELRDVSCLTFTERTNQANYINIRGFSDGCYATVGYNGGAQTLNLAPNNPGVGCFRHGTIVHEFLHSLGFYHMQSTHDRDDWVDIIWDKIQSGTEHNFNKYLPSQVSNFGEDYDYGSVLHYSEYGFSTDGSRTIVPKQDTTGITIGQRIRMSDSDIARLNKLYEC